MQNSVILLYGFTSFMKNLATAELRHTSQNQDFGSACISPSMPPSSLRSSIGRIGLYNTVRQGAEAMQRNRCTSDAKAARNNDLIRLLKQTQVGQIQGFPEAKQGLNQYDNTVL